MGQHKIAIIGEAWGEAEERERAPFVGPSGFELTRMLSEAGIVRAECFLTNVFNLRPRPANDIKNLCVPKKEDRSNLPPLAPGKYLDATYLPEVHRLLSEMREVRPNIAIAMGNTACWALLGSGAISRIRGTVAASRTVPGLKVLPTYHPAAILRQWELRHVTILDLIKAKRESEFPEIRRPERYIITDPSLEDLDRFYEEHIRSARRIAFDIETAGDQITCIGFATSCSVAIVVPFVDHRRLGGSYWEDTVSEQHAWQFVDNVLNSEASKVAQNGLYDIHFLWRQYGLTVRNFDDDTMLLHHSLQPESPKGLDFLGSVYTNEPAWKLMRPRGKHTIKKDA